MSIASLNHKKINRNLCYDKFVNEFKNTIDDFIKSFKEIIV